MTKEKIFKIIPILFAGCLITAFAVGIIAYNFLMTRVIIIDKQQEIEIVTWGDTVEEALIDAGIKTNEYDMIEPGREEKILRDRENTILITRAIPVNVKYGKDERIIHTCSNTVGDLLKTRVPEFDDDDILTDLSLDDSIYENMTITIINLEKKVVKSKEDIEYHIKTIPNENMEKGTRIISREGILGIMEKEYNVTYINGQETERELVSERITRRPVNKIIEYGTVSSYISSRGDRIRYENVLDMRATAYTASFKDTGKHPDHPEFGITFSGMKARLGVIAVDPEVIPLGTKVYVEVLGNVPDYGYAIAADIGSAIKGDLIDLYLEDQETVDRWGCKKVRVYILNEQKLNVFSMR